MSEKPRTPEDKGSSNFNRVKARIMDLIGIYEDPNAVRVVDSEPPTKSDDHREGHEAYEMMLSPVKSRDRTSAELCRRKIEECSERLKRADLSPSAKISTLKDMALFQGMAGQSMQAAETARLAKILETGIVDDPRETKNIR